MSTGYPLLYLESGEALVRSKLEVQLRSPLDRMNDDDISTELVLLLERPNHELPGDVFT